MPKRNVKYFLSTIKDPSKRESAREFYKFCLSKKVTARDMDMPSWSVAIRKLGTYLNYGPSKTYTPTVVGTYEAWLSSQEPNLPWGVGSEFSGGEPIELTRRE